MKVVKVISKSGNSKMEVVTDEGTTKHIVRNGSVWNYLHGTKVNEFGDVKTIYKPIEVGGNK